MPENKKNKKIPREIRKEIRQRAKTESGRRGQEAKPETGVGHALRQKFGKGKYKRKLVGAGTKRGRETTVKPPPPRYKKVKVQAKTFESRKGETGRSKTLTAKTQSGLKTATKKATKSIGIKNFKSKSDVGKKEFKENAAKRKSYRRDIAKTKTPHGKRTEAQLEKRQELRNMRTAHIKEAGGRIGKGERTMKRSLKKRMKKDYREGRYKKY